MWKIALLGAVAAGAFALSFTVFRFGPGLLETGLPAGSSSDDRDRSAKASRSSESEGSSSDTSRSVQGPGSSSGPSSEASPSLERSVGSASGSAHAVPSDGPPGMVWIPGGTMIRGSGNPKMRDAMPRHKAAVDGFWMDRTAVTNEQFEQFVKATGYVTVAERTPNPKDFPGAPPENLVAGSVVFTPPREAVPLDNHFRWWSYVKGANWRHPDGPTSNLEGRARHPVLQVAWEDAVAYAKWAGKRLPTEAEFEFAARGGLEDKKYAWGDELKPNGKWMANIWQGKFPIENTEEDGFRAAAPVGSFPPNGYGLYDMSGNVWQWCSDWYRADYYQQLVAANQPVRNPQGPRDSFDPSERNVAKRVMRGGSYLCCDQYCSAYEVGARGKGAPDTGTNHVGFRCVATESMWEEKRKNPR